MSVLIYGCGYLGLQAARLWLQADRRVTAVTRSQQRGQRLAELGLAPLVADLGQDAPLPATSAETILFSVGFDRTPGQSIDGVYVEGLRRALQAADPQATRRLIYISTTGVYGGGEAETVNEQTPCQPQRPGSVASWEAEQLLAQHDLGARAVVLRLAGIYGANRIPRAADVAAGRPLAADPQAWLNLIHIQDAAAAVLAAERVDHPPQTFVVSDGAPVQRREFYELVAQRLGAPAPVFSEPAAGSRGAQRGGKRIDNSKMRCELLGELQYPSYREGLAAIFAEP